MLPLLRGDMRADTVLSLEAEMRANLQKPGLVAHKKAKGCMTALQKFLSHEEQSDQKRGKIIPAFPEENKR